MGRFPLLATMALFVAAPMALLVAPVLQSTGRRLALLAAILLLAFCARGWLKTYSAQDQWACVTRQHQLCDSQGGASSPNSLGSWIARHVG